MKESSAAGTNCDGEWSRDEDHNGSRLRCRSDIACEPNCGIGAESQLIDHLVLFAIDISKVYWMVSSRMIPNWTLQTWAGEVKVLGFQGLHRGSGTVCASVNKRVKGVLHKFYEGNGLSVLGERILHTDDASTSGS